MEVYGDGLILMACALRLMARAAISIYLLLKM
jgi:hypothetical protein